MNILILNWKGRKNPGAGGAETVTFGHAKRWVEKGHHVTWLTTAFPGSTSEEIDEGILMLHSGSLKTIYFRIFWYVVTHKKNIDLIVDEIHGIPFLTPLYTRKPVVGFIHEVADEIWDYMYPFPLSKIGKYLERFLLRIYRRKQIWTDADSTAVDLVRLGFNKHAIAAIPCPTDMVPVDVLPKKAKHPTFIFISRLVKMKGIEEVIKAFAFIHQEDSSAMLHIIGRGKDSYIQFLRKMVDTYHLTPSVTFHHTASNNDKKELLRKSHILLHASVKEGWGLVIIEAASQATPSVVYNVGGLRDSVKDKMTGIILRENSPWHMAQAALTLMRDEGQYKMLQENCLSYVRALTWDNVADESIQLLTKTYHKRRKG